MSMIIRFKNQASVICDYSFGLEGYILKISKNNQTLDAIWMHIDAGYYL
jgi:hypothetical protein